MVKHYKKITILMLSIFSICILLNIYLNFHYICTRPPTPQPEIGRIYPLNVHGWIVYLTRNEEFQLNFLFFAGAILFIMAAIITNIRGDPFNKNK
jgi:hypothetical protein